MNKRMTVNGMQNNTRKYNVKDICEWNSNQFTDLVRDNFEEFYLIEDGLYLFTDSKNIKNYIDFIELMYRNGLDFSENLAGVTAIRGDWPYETRYITLDNGIKIGKNIGLDKILHGICSCLKWMSNNKGLDLSRYVIELLYK